MKKIGYVLILFALIAMRSQAGVIINEDFSTTGVSEGVRYYAADTNKWVSRYSNWTMVETGEARALNCDLADDNSETSLAHLVAVNETDTSLTKIKISFDYTVPADATLYLHVSGYTGPLLGTLQSRMTAVNGTYYATSADDFSPNLGTTYNLKDGGTPWGGTANSLASFSNTSGTFSQTVDISAFSGIDDITDFNYMTVIFGVDETAESGTIIIDNITVTAIPEPTTLAFVSAMGGGLLFIRRFMQI
jgi:hypothetical protein